MAYTIKPEHFRKCDRIIERLDRAIRVDKRFMFEPMNLGDRIEIRKVRLLKAKPYCGQHAGPCQTRFGGNPPLRNSRYLEAEDWIAFHDVINDVLDKLKLRADVWSLPQDNKGKFWIRRVELGRRVRWDYADDGTRRKYGQEHNVFNTGTPDQFQEV